MTISVTFCRTDHSKKKVMTKNLTKRWLLKGHQALLDTPTVGASDYHNSVRDADKYFVSI